MDKATQKQPIDTLKIDQLSDPTHTESKPIDEFLIKNIRHILLALADLQDLDSFEVFIKIPGEKNLEKLFHAGHLEDIWSEDAYSDNSSLLKKYLLKGEVRD